MQTSPQVESTEREDLGTHPIQFLDLKAQYATIKNEITHAVLQCLETQRFIMGPEVEAFEREMATWNSSKSAISCASGSDALLLALMALEIGPGDEVITTPFTFVATVGAIVRLGAKPVFVDIHPETFNLDALRVGEVITKRTRAIIPVHLFGCPADLNPILAVAKAHNVPVIEDAAQAIGARYHNQQVGNLGLMGCFSFFPSKNLGCAGDGGLVTTNDEELAARVRVLRTHGSRKRYSYELVGMNSRLDALQAAILRVKLRHLTAWTKGRRSNANKYSELFSEWNLDGKVSVPYVPDYAYHIYNQFTVRTADRDAMRSHLTSLGIPTEIYYPSPLHLQAAFSFLGYKPGDYPEAERASGEVFSLPIYPELPAQHQVAVVQAIASYYRD
ncbi:MAG: DegT/DnrJ/EryC1/StrS family aminotransferase [Acidobacteriaceae bacterium]|nr:DegT/DnrJ/EryC1/StrS family aminotransferase [Acidobacteriaceae bacterium]